MADIHLKTSNRTGISVCSASNNKVNVSGSALSGYVGVDTSAQNDIDVGSTPSKRVSTHDSTMPKYVGARAVVDRVIEGVRITLTDYKGTTQEIVREGEGADIEAITNSELEEILV